MEGAKEMQILAGKLENGAKVYLNFEVRHNEGTTTTINHEDVTGYDVLSISGTVVRKGGSIKRDGDCLSAGQVISWLKNVTQPASGLTLAGVARIGQIWNEWHLNDMQTHCVHQTAGKEWHSEPACTVTGYKAGTAWLLKPLPADIVAEINNLFSEAVAA